MNPKSYIYNNDKSSKTKLGLIAQDVKALVLEAVKGDESLDMLNMSYETLIPVLINAIKVQQNIIEALRLENHQTKDALMTMSADIEELKSLIKHNSSTTTSISSLKDY